MRIRGEIGDLNQTMWAARSRAEVMDSLAEIEALKSTLDALELGGSVSWRRTAHGPGRGSPGWLSTAKAHVIERTVGTLPGNPEQRARGVQALLVEAKALDATELRKLAVRLLAIVDPDGDERRAERALDRKSAPLTWVVSWGSPMTGPVVPGSRDAAAPRTPPS